MYKITQQYSVAQLRKKRAIEDRTKERLAG